MDWVIQGPNLVGAKFSTPPDQT